MCSPNSQWVGPRPGSRRTAASVHVASTGPEGRMLGLDHRAVGQSLRVPEQECEVGHGVGGHAADTGGKQARLPIPRPVGSGRPPRGAPTGPRRCDHVRPQVANSSSAASSDRPATSQKARNSWSLSAERNTQCESGFSYGSRAPRVRSRGLVEPACRSRAELHVVYLFRAGLPS